MRRCLRLALVLSKDLIYDTDVTEMIMVVVMLNADGGVLVECRVRRLMKTTMVSTTSAQYETRPAVNKDCRVLLRYWLIYHLNHLLLSVLALINPLQYCLISCLNPLLLLLFLALINPLHDYLTSN